jgi:PA domain
MSSSFSFIGKSVFLLHSYSHILWGLLEISGTQLISAAGARNVQPSTVTEDRVNEDASVRAAAVFVGFGVSAPALEYDDYAGTDVRGKIVVMLYGAPPRFASAERAHYSSPPIKAEQAAAHGAVGLIYLWVGEMATHVPFPKIVELFEAPQYRWLDARSNPNDNLPQLRGGGFLSGECARRLDSSPKTLDQVIADGNAAKPQSFSLPLEVNIHALTRHTSVSSPNVAALLRGSDPQLRDQYIVYTAHSDHLASAEQ